jgi:hypothetical protein
MGRLGRTVLALFVLAFAMPVGANVAVASCIQQDLAAQVAGAEVIAFGTVTETRQTFAAASGVIMFRPERLLKGTLTSEVRVYLGPSHGSAITSVDYFAATRGERHTLYLRSFIDDGAYETNACSGSHAGAPSADEEGALGRGTLVAAATDEPLALAAVAAVLVALALAAAGLIALRRRKISS